jgi:hypothetical protein
MEKVEQTAACGLGVPAMTSFCPGDLQAAVTLQSLGAYHHLLRFMHDLLCLA